MIFHVRIDCTDTGQGDVRHLKLELSEFSTGSEIAGVAERYAERLGWKRFTVTILKARAIAPERIGSPQQ